MGEYQQQLYEKLCQMSPLVRTGIFLLLSCMGVAGSGLLLKGMLSMLFPIIESTLVFVVVGMMWLVWLVACIIGVYI